MTEKENIDAQELIRAAETGDRAGIESLVAAGADVNARTPGGETALMRAASRGRAAIVKLLLERGADPNLRRQDNWTALMLAAFFGHTDAVCALVCGGADPLAADRNGATAFAWAASRGNVEAAKFLKDAETVAEGYRRRLAAERVVAQQEPAAQVAQKATEKVHAPTAFVSPPDASRAKKLEEEKPEDVFAAATQLLPVAPVPVQVRAEATEPSAEGARTSAVVREARKTKEDSRFRRAAIYAAPLLLIACGALAYRLYDLSSKTDDVRATPTHASEEPAKGVSPQAQPVAVSPIAPAPSAEQAAQSANVSATPGIQMPTGYPPDYTSTFNYPPAADIPYGPAPVVRTPAQAASDTSGEPSVVSLAQPEQAGEKKTTQPAAERQTRDEAPAPRVERPNTARSNDAADSPKPSPTPKAKVIQWP